MSVNLLDLIPERKLKFEESSDEIITLIKPKFKHRILVQYVLPRMKKPNFKIKLDRFGSVVWKNCDGDKTVGQIGTILKEKFDDQIDPVYERLAAFIQTLVRHKFIEYKNYQPEKK